MASRACGLSILALAAVAGACGDDTGPPPMDAGAPDSAMMMPFVVEAPALPAAPAPPARACPDGFTTTEDGVCDPFPDGVLDCGPAEIHVPGSARCERLGPACPADGEWATDLPSSGVVRYVRAGAAAGGDGSQTAPYASIGDATAVAGAGDVIAVARGTYDETVSLRAGVTLHGACAEGTIVSPSFSATVLTAGGLDVAVKNLTLTGGRVAVSVNRTTGARLENVIVSDSRDTAIRVLLGARLEADGLIVRGTRPLVDGGAFGRGLDAEGDSTAIVSRALFEDNTDFSVFVATDTELTLDRVIVRGTRPQENDGAHGRGLNVIAGASATVTRSFIADNQETGVLFSGEGTTGTLEDVVIRRTAPARRRAGVGTGSGLAVEVGASVEARGLLVADSHFGGVGVISEAELSGEDVVIAGVAPDAAGDSGLGVTVERSSMLTLRRAVIRDCHTVAVSGKDLDSFISLEDVRVSRVAARENDGDLGMGAGILRGARAELRRVHIEDTAVYGLYADSSETTVLADDLAVARTGTAGGPGFGVVISRGAAFEGARLSLEDISEIGIMAGLEGASVVVDDVTIQRVTQRFIEEQDRHYGAGIQLEDDGTMMMNRVSIAEAAHSAIFVFSGTMTLTDLTISTPTEDDLGELGYGLTATEGADVTLTRALVDGVFGAGISAFDTARIVATGLEVRDTSSNTGRGKLGWGAAAVNGGSLELTGARLTNNREAALMAQGEGASIVASDLVIENTQANACSIDGSCAGGAGFGVSASGGTVRLSDFRIAGNALGGVQVINGGGADLSDGVIADNPIGVNIQDDPDYDFARVTESVAFVNNERNIDSAIVPIPDTGLTATGLVETPDEPDL